MSRNDRDNEPLIPQRIETTSLVDKKPFEHSPIRSRPTAPESTVRTVVSSRLALSAERAVTGIYREVEKQAAATRAITEDLTSAYRTRADTVVYVEERQTDFLEAKLKQQRILEQMRIDRALAPQQQQVQSRQLDRAAAEADAAISLAEQQSREAGDERRASKRHAVALEEQRIRRTNELEEAEHRARVAELSAAQAVFARRTQPREPEPPKSGDWLEAFAVAEDVSEGLVVTDTHHLYHGFAALLWLGCVKRGLDHDLALKHVADRVLDRQQRHPLSERDARAYHDKYLTELAAYTAEETARKTAAEKERKRAAASTEAQRKIDADLRKAALDRDAALARERTARTFIDTDDFDPRDDGDAN